MDKAQSIVLHPAFRAYLESGRLAADLKARMVRQFEVMPHQEWMLRHIERATEDMLRLDRDGGQDDYVRIVRLMVPASQRGYGIGEALLSGLCVVADRCGWTLTATPSGEWFMNVSRLRRWYRRHGFIRNKGRHKDHATQTAMYRVAGSGQ